MSGPDVSVRLAWAVDAAAIGRVQVAVWRMRYDGMLPAELLESLSADDFATNWRTSITHPKEARQRILVALEGADMRGFVAMSPAADADADPSSDAEIVELAVDPAQRSRGHGSRLLHAAADTLRSDRFRRATVWLPAADESTRGFLESQGWAPDGAHRQLDLDGSGTTLVKQVRLHTDLGAE